MKLRLIIFAFFVGSRSVVVGQTVDPMRNVEAFTADPAQNVEAFTTDPVISNTPEGQQSLINRLETMENAFRAMVSALSNQPSDFFASIKETLVKDPYLSSFLSTTSFLPSVGAPPTNGKDNVTLERTAQVTKEILQKGKNMVDNLKTVVKCSLAHLVDIDTIRDFSSGVNGSALITASLTSNESFEIDWIIPSAECIELSTGVWIRVYESGDEYKWPAETFLSIPQKCMKKKSESFYSLTLSPPPLSTTGQEDPCKFSLTRNLTQCRSYVVEVVPNYQSLRGKTLRTEFVVPPKLTEDANMKSTFSAVMNGDLLKLNWKDNSGCQPQMTSLNLKIYLDGFVDSQKQNISTLTIPRSCLSQHTNDGNLFTMVLPTNQQTCSIAWQPLDKCRKYRLEMSSQYTSTWNGRSTSMEIITKGYEVANNTADSSVMIWRCPRKHFHCSSNQGCWPSSYDYVCDGRNHCDDGRDEHHCDPVCKNGFKCGRQCIPEELVCNGEVNCLDGSDEDYSCSYGNMCQQFTNSSGNFSSHVFPGSTNRIHSDMIADAVRKTAVLISVQPNHQIWLTFEKCITFANQHFVKVYDGPYKTSPLLISKSGSQKPFSVRSSSNELYVEFPSYYATKQYGILAVYTSINASRTPFIQGCGGYIKGEGVISTSNYSTNPDITDCFWFLEAKDSEDTIVLSNSDFISVQRMQSTTPAPISNRRYSLQYDSATPSPVKLPLLAEAPPFVIYDGWSTVGPVLYNGEADAEAERRAVTYSISSKMMIHLISPVVRENPVFSWTVSRISPPQCNHTFDAPSGIIKSPNYPLAYTHLSDCRWNVNVKPGSTVRLLFAFFETQAQADFLYVFDGPTVYAKRIFEKSGSTTTPFEIRSTTNQVLIRFTSDANTALHGFLAVYSIV